MIEYYNKLISKQQNYFIIDFNFFIVNKCEKGI